MRYFMKKCFFHLKKVKNYTKIDLFFYHKEAGNQNKDIYFEDAGTI